MNLIFLENFIILACIYGPENIGTVNFAVDIPFLMSAFLPLSLIIPGTSIPGKSVELQLTPHLSGNLRQRCL